MSLANLISSSEIRLGKNPGNFFICCPYCIDRVGKVDTGFKLGISLDKNIFHCFRCEASGKIDSSFKENLSYKVDKVDVYATLMKRLRHVTTYGKTVPVELNIFSNPITQDSTPVSYEYLIKERGFTEEFVVKNNIRSGKSYEIDGEEVSTWRGRVIFPYMRGADCLYAVGRSYVGHSKKYINTVGSKASVVYGLEKLDGVGILCEGILSSYAAEMITGVPAVACLGKSPSMTQLSMIRNRCHTLYQSLDADVTNLENIRIAETCINMGFKLRFVKIPLKMIQVGSELKKLSDPDDHRKDYSRYFKESRELNLLNYKRVILGKE